MKKIILLPPLFICIFINLLVGNIVLFFMSLDLGITYHILISLVVLAIYSAAFYKMDMQNKRHTKWRLAGISILLSLSAMLAACILTSVSMRLPMDNIISAAAKGIIPMFIFALVFASPFWIPLAVVNFICLINCRKK